MAEITITNLTPAGALTGAELFEAVQAGVSVNTSLTDMAAFVGTALSVDDLSDVAITAVADREFLEFNAGSFINRTYAEAGVADLEDTGTQTFQGALVIQGNLTVQGTTTAIDSNVVNIGDNIITLNADEVGAPTQNAGLEIERGTSANVELRWNETTDEWELNDGAIFQTIIHSGNQSPGYLVPSATDRAISVGAGTSNTGNNVLIAGAGAGLVNTADEVFIWGVNAAPSIADIDFAGSIIIGARAAFQAISAGTAQPSVIIGRDAFENNDSTVSGYNVILGPRAANFSQAGGSSTGMNRSVVIGAEAGERAADNSFNNATLIGYRAGRCNTANLFVNPNGATYIGANAGANQQSGANNTAVGTDAMSLAAIIGNENTALGLLAGSNIFTGSDNTLLGSNCGTGVTGASGNVFVGQLIAIDAGESVIIGKGATAAATQVRQVILGYRSGRALAATGHHFVVESAINSGLTIKSYLWGDMNNGNLALGFSNNGVGDANNRDFGAGAPVNIFKIHDSPTPPTGPATAGATMYSAAGALNVIGGMTIRDDTAVDSMTLTDSGTLAAITTNNNPIEIRAGVGLAVQIVDGSVFSISDSTEADFISILHDGTRAVITTSGAGGGLLRISPATGHTEHFISGVNSEITVWDSTGSDRVRILHDGTSAQIGTPTTDGNLILFSTDLAVELWGINERTFSADGNGACSLYGDQANDTDARILNFRDSAGLQRAFVGHNAEAPFQIRNVVHGASLDLYGEDTGGTPRLLFRGDPDLDVKLYQTGVEAFRTRADNATMLTQAQVRHADNNFYDIGLGKMPILEQDAATNLTVDLQQKLIHKDAGGALSFTCINDSNIQTGTVWTITNEENAVLTIAQGTGVTLRWFDGVTVGGATGSRSVASGGVVTVVKYLNLEYFIWGFGIS